MTENQLRDVLSRVVPEPPDSVADASPVVRVARRKRQIRVAGATALAAVLVAGTVIGVQSLGGDEKKYLVADQPAIADPYTTASCPDIDEDWPVATTATLSDVSAVRYCGRPFNGFPASNGPADALVSGLDDFRAAIAAMPAADPGRCAAIDVLPSDSRLLLAGADQMLVGIAAGPCQDVVVDGRTLDGADVTQAFLAALRSQRDAHPYSVPADSTPLDCQSSSESPAEPGHEEIVAAVVCSPDGNATPTSTLDAAGLADLNAAWNDATRPDRDISVEDPCLDLPDAPSTLRARTDRGDTLYLVASPCGFLGFDTWQFELPSCRLPVALEDLTG